MAMSETMPPGQNDWAQFYQHSLAPAVLPQSDVYGGGRVSDATVVTTTVTSPTAPSSLGQGRLSPEGRVSKPVRRRTRASRRTPTTVLNTDTTNFRAMVQQFTGGPGLAAQPGHYPIPSGSNLSFGFGLSGNVNNINNNPPPPPHHHHNQQLVNPTPARTTSGYNVQFQPPPPSGPSFMFTPSSQHRRHNSNVAATLEGLSFPFRGSSSSGNDNMNETNNYMF